MQYSSAGRKNMSLKYKWWFFSDRNRRDKHAIYYHL